MKYRKIAPLAIHTRSYTLLQFKLILMNTHEFYYYYYFYSTIDVNSFSFSKFIHLRIEYYYPYVFSSLMKHNERGKYLNLFDAEDVFIALFCLEIEK